MANKENMQYCGFGTYISEDGLHGFEKKASGEFVEVESRERAAERRFVEQMLSKTAGKKERGAKP